MNNIFYCPQCHEKLSNLECRKCGNIYIKLKNNIFSFMPETKPVLPDIKEIRKRQTIISRDKFAEEIINFVIKTIGDRKGLFLDVGCGTGYYSSKILKKLGNDVNFIGLDIQVNFNYEISEQHYTFVQADFFNNPFGAEVFDVIMNFDVIEHFQDDYLFIKMIINLLKKDGIFIIGTPNGRRLPVIWHELLHGKRKFPVSYGDDDIYNEILHIREYSKPDIVKLMDKFTNQVEYKIIPMLFGARIGQKMIGIKYPIGIFGNFCYYWWIIGVKK